MLTMSSIMAASKIGEQTSRLVALTNYAVTLKIFILRNLAVIHMNLMVTIMHMYKTLLSVMEPGV